MQFDLGVVTVKPLLFRRKRRRLRDPVRTHAIVARPDRRDVVHLIEFLLAPGEALHPCGARLPHPDEARERIEGPILRFGDAAGQHIGVLDALSAALGVKRHHRMRGVAHQHDTTDLPVRQRLAVVQRLAQDFRRLRDDRSNGRMPAVIFGQRILGPAFRQPGFLRGLR